MRWFLFNIKDNKAKAEKKSFAKESPWYSSSASKKLCCSLSKAVEQQPQERSKSEKLSWLRLSNICMPTYNQIMVVHTHNHENVFENHAQWTKIAKIAELIFLFSEKSKNRQIAPFMFWLVQNKINLTSYFRIAKSLEKIRQIVTFMR